MFSIIFLSYVILIGGIWRNSRVRTLVRKAGQVEALPLYFRDRLNTSQLAAIYDILVRGPAVLWEDFAGLTDLELVRDGVRRYRDFTMLHFTIQSLSYVRIGVVIGVVGLLVAFWPWPCRLRSVLTSFERRETGAVPCPAHLKLSFQLALANPGMYAGGVRAGVPAPGVRLV